MGTIPADATHWDSGDWIDWHRKIAARDESPCAAPSADPRARLHTLRTRMLQCARTYFELTGKHLPIYEGIARIHASLAFDLPTKDPAACDIDTAPMQLITIPPHGAHDVFTVDFAAPFCCLIVVRITDSFLSEARMMPRTALPDRSDRPVELRWGDLPNGT